ncbi:MAG: signal peptidase I [Ruminococcaceae bacterium]|nr:signal peptidase I [Oscillospiraceae bacterium]
MKQETKAKKKNSKLRKFLNILSTVILLAATAVVVFVFVLRLTGAKPKLFGYYVFNVASDSMTPMLEINDVILVKECDPQTIHKGDVISYHALSGEMAGKDITHKVIKEPEKDTGGTLRITTKGIKPGAITDPVISGGQVIGKYVRTLKVLSFLFTLFKTWYGLLIFLAIIFIFMGTEIYNLAKLSKKADAVEVPSEEEVKQWLKEQEAEQQKTEDSIQKTEDREQK